MYSKSMPVNVIIHKNRNMKLNNLMNNPEFHKCFLPFCIVNILYERCRIQLYTSAYLG